MKNAIKNIRNEVKSKANDDDNKKGLPLLEVNPDD